MLAVLTFLSLVSKTALLTQCSEPTEQASMLSTSRPLSAKTCYTHSVIVPFVICNIIYFIQEINLSLLLYRIFSGFTTIIYYLPYNIKQNFSYRDNILPLYITEKNYLKYPTTYIYLGFLLKTLLVYNIYIVDSKLLDYQNLFLFSTAKY